MKKIMVASCAALTLAACATFTHEYAAQANLAPTQGNHVNGVVAFTQRGDKVIVDADIMGLAPGMHGFHIHEKGDCSAPDGTSAGGHFNPNNQPHGDPSGAAHHAGDMPMLMAGADGRAKLHAELAAASLQPGPQNIIGKAVIIHQKVDDFTTQPTGNSGARVACGVIVAK